MNKRKYIVSTVFAIIITTIYSCGGSGNSNPYEVSEEWKAFQGAIYSETSSDPAYTKLQCLTQNGYLYYKKLTGNEFPPVTVPTGIEGMGANDIITPKISEDGYPYFNDSVVVRYLGWHHYENAIGEKKTFYFDGTESNPPDYNFNNQAGIGSKISGLTTGFSSMLQYMKAGDKVQVCIPYNLAYGELGNVPNQGTIQGYTTLFFNIYLMKIIPINPGEYPGVDTGEGNH